MNGENLAYATKSSNEVERPDFARILETLQKEAANGFDLTNSLTSLANGIKGMEIMPESGIPEVKEKSPSCLVDYLWAEVWKIRRTNAQLEKVVFHLQRTIGN